MFCDIDKYVDQLTELYPRPKVAAEFKRKIIIEYYYNLTKTYDLTTGLHDLTRSY